jgi:hypothetical protein
MSKRSGDLAQPQDTPQMDQVRDLLFGSQLKDMETRFRRQEERFLREVADCRDGLKTRLDSLENFMKSEINGILHRLKEEQNERDESLKTEQRERGEGLKAEQRERAEQIKNEQRDRVEALKNEQRERMEAVALLSKDLATAVETLERKIAKVAGALDMAERELRQILLAESASLSNKTEERYQNALDVLANTAAQIRHDMVYRSSFSAMLTEMAVKLSGQWSRDLSPLVAIQDAQQDDNDGESRPNGEHGSEDA